jgi:hypothetical protein
MLISAARRGLKPLSTEDVVGAALFDLDSVRAL